MRHLQPHHGPLLSDVLTYEQQFWVQQRQDACVSCCQDFQLETSSDFLPDAHGSARAVELMHLQAQPQSRPYQRQRGGQPNPH